jgi:HAD superfamily hydrolase (TIGR01509 family)
VDLRALVFDFDGTIAETERFGHRVAYNEAFEELGLHERWDEETYGALLGVAGGRERLEVFFARVRPFLDRTARAALARRVHEVKRRRFDAIGPSIPLRPGVERLALAARAAGLRVAIATTAAREGVDAVLRGHPALGGAIEAIAAGDDVPRKKPAPDIYELVLRDLGLEAGVALAIEDSAIGLQSARAAGLPALVTPSGYTAAENFAGAAAVVSDLGEPDRHCTTLAGPSPPAGFVDLAYCRSLTDGSGGSGG